MKKKEFLNLDLKTIHFPISAIASILHRISGIIIFFFIGILLFMLDLSLSSIEEFLLIKNIINNHIFKFILWNIFTVLIYHLLSGIRHILMDFGFIKETLLIGNYSAKIIFIITVLLYILIGVFIW